MTWQLKLAPYEQRKEIGAIWSYPSQPDRLFITLPCGSLFPANGHNDHPQGGWVVTGEPPNLTMQPSIRVHGGWHGYITNGVISDDVEGRQY